MSRCVIVGGADIRDPGGIEELFEPDDVFVYCDSGLRHLEALRREPALTVGDFDSFLLPEEGGGELIVLPREKDDTDTAFAVKEMLRRGYRDFLLTGVTGGRIDHTLGNLSLLMMLDSAGARGMIADDRSVTEIVSGKPAFVTDRWPYFSLLAAGGEASGVTVTGAKYPLADAVLTPDFPLGVSNEVTPGQTAEIRVAVGRLFLIRDKE